MDDKTDPYETKDLQEPDPAPPGEAIPDAPRTVGRYRVERLLGQGGFGRVYLARDDELERPVAIKIPNRDRISRPEDVEAYLNEARILASLEHPHIVPVYDVGRTHDGLFYVVSRYVEGCDLAARIRKGRPSYPESAGLVAAVAEALHHAHARGLVHRDIKPANILIDTAGKPCVADFGLALRSEEYGQGARLAGTPDYMSPEQARGEGHRVDGRSDICSLGVVFYELLTGRRPFSSPSRRELLDLIATTEARPPRQVDDTIPKELERICLKALAKRASERYTTARDFADDLRAFLQTVAGTVAPGIAQGVASPLPGSTQQATPHPTTPRASDSDQLHLKVVPKGLRSFDEHDADFFLELLPGPRDREGLPESLRFWKTRIETTDPDKTFRVGLIYGPSGCGKSSLVKAGLLPRLAKHIVPVYIEATSEETEARLMRELQKACSELPPAAGLVACVSAIRQGRVLRTGQKALLIVDQFEQWLHANRGVENTELVAALRHCDGQHVQAVVLVRDDFWLAASRFMRELEIRLVEGDNSALVDLFDPRHARKVLTAFGRAYGTLPDRRQEFTRDQEAFLDQSVNGLAQDGKVVPVRLALFSEIVKGKPWTAVTLRAVGGTEGVGVAFLEETFSSTSAPPEHRLHQRAAQAVLRALLPGTGSDIKGQMRSESELQEAAGYLDQPRDFADLTHILDNELRLISPTDPEGVESGRWRVEGEGGRVEGGSWSVKGGELVERHGTRSEGGGFLERTELSGTGGLAVGDGTGGAVLSGDEGVSEGRGVRARQPDPARGGVDPGQHRRGSGAGPYQGVSEQLEHRPGIAHGAGNASAAEQSDRHSAPGGARDSAGAERPDQPHAQRPTQSTAETPGNLKLTHPSTLHPPRPTRYYQLTHDYLVPSLRDWLTRKQRESRRGRAELRLADRSSLWNAQPENRHLPSLLEWANIRLLTSKKDWTDPERLMMQRAGWTHGLKVLVATGLISLLGWGAVDSYGRLRASSLVDSLETATTADAPTIVRQLGGYRRWANPLLQKRLEKAVDASREKLNASLALLPVDASQVDYLFNRLIRATPGDFGVLRNALKPHQAALVPRLWSVLESAQLDAANLLPTAATLADYDASSPKWDSVRGDVAHALVKLNPSDLGPWLGNLRPIRDQLNAPLAAIFSDKDHPETERTLATDILIDYARDDPTLIANLLMVAEPTAYARLFPIAEQKGAQPLPQFEQEIGMRAVHGWDDPSLEVSWTAPDQALSGKIESAQGVLTDRFAFCQSMPLKVFLEVVDRLRNSGYRPLQVRPYSDGPVVRVASVWTRDHQPWEFEPQLSRDDLDRRIKELGLEGLVPVDLAGYVPADAPDSKAMYACVWNRRDPAGDSIQYTADVQIAEVQNVFDRMKNDGFRPRSIQSFAGSVGTQRYCQIWEKGDSSFIRQTHGKPETDFLDLLELEHHCVCISLVPNTHQSVGQHENRYDALWNQDSSFSSTELLACESTAHRFRATRLASQGYRPISISVARMTSDGPLLTASVWHRPWVNEDDKDKQAERQARAAVALVRLGKPEAVWPLLDHSPDPRLRSFLVNWLYPLGADPHIIAAELDRIDTEAKPMPAPGESWMDAILFHPETSRRRALILALGTYGTDRLSLAERETLTDKLLGLYCKDPDSGIHGAAEWTLRQWDKQEKVQAADAGLMQLNDRGDRRWSVNSQGQTFVVIEGPVVFHMGSLASEPDHGKDEIPRRVGIARRFIIASKEVTVEQYQRFLEAHPELGHLEIGSDSPEARQPMNGMTWYRAAAYCNWLSEEEGLSRDQWCYLRDPEGTYGEGMTIPADVLKRTGYRLPTEAEWEYACRSGTETRFYHGFSTDLLGSYAWYGSNSRDHARPVGSRLPNDLGLFDMLGNVYEWAQDPVERERQYSFADDIHSPENVDLRNARLVRGGSFDDLAVYVRSSFRYSGGPSFGVFNFGFRPARTLP